MKKDKKEKWISSFYKTKLCKMGGSCFECCDYEGIVDDQIDLIRFLLKSEKQDLKKKVEEMKKFRPDHVCNSIDWCLIPECNFNRALSNILELLEE